MNMPDCIFCSKMNVCLKFAEEFAIAKAKFKNGDERHQYILKQMYDCPEYAENVV